MKKNICISTLLIFLLTSTCIFSQEALKKGNYSLSGSISFSTGSNESKYDQSDNTTFYFSPAYTYFLIDNLTSGISIAYGYFENTWEYNGEKYKNINRPISIGPVIRYYFPSEKFIPFIEANYQYSNSIQGNEDVNSYSISGGINYFLTKSVALEPYIEYRKTKYEIWGQTISTFSLGMRFNYFIVD